MPFLENAFIHVEGSIDTPGIIISLSINDNNLKFRVMNHNKDYAKKVIEEERFSIASIKRYLDLQFGNNFSLYLNNEANKYTVYLSITLF
jgi:LytS/YehU family sensor histidine kinase